MPATMHRLPGLLLTDHEFRIPLDHRRPAGGRSHAISQHLRGPMYRVLRKEYSKRIACLEASTTKALSY